MQNTASFWQPLEEGLLGDFMTGTPFQHDKPPMHVSKVAQGWVMSHGIRAID